MQEISAGRLAFDRAIATSGEIKIAVERIAFDFVSARTIDPNSGHLHVAQTNISKATVNPYRGSGLMPKNSASTQTASINFFVIPTR